MSLLLLKLILTPSLIGAASLAGRKWGHAISGWIVALPLTTGPIVFLLALTHGPAFAADTAAGILAGGFSLVAFVLTYARLALQWGWLPTLAASTVAFCVMTAILAQVHLPLMPLWIAGACSAPALPQVAAGTRLPPPSPGRCPASGTFRCACSSPQASWC